MCICGLGLLSDFWMYPHKGILNSVSTVTPWWSLKSQSKSSPSIPNKHWLFSCPSGITLPCGKIFHHFCNNLFKEAVDRWCREEEVTDQNSSLHAKTWTPGKKKKKRRNWLCPGYPGLSSLLASDCLQTCLESSEKAVGVRELKKLRWQTSVI